MARASVAFYQHQACGRHDTGWRHPEHQGRLRSVAEAVARALPELHGRVEPARADPLPDEALGAVHQEKLLARIRDAVKEAEHRGEPVHLTPDTTVSAASWEAAAAAAGCAVHAVEAVCSGERTAAFCATRPPGHHATPGRSMGFCLVNHVALAARHAVDRGLAGRVLVVDWDVHHGNGTQDIFWEDPDVFYLSMHQSPHYPGTGDTEERGAGPGEGTTLNVPLPPGLSTSRYEQELLAAVERALEGFEPELVLVSAGFDSGRGDPLGGFTLEEESYHRLTTELVRLTRPTARGRVVSVMEGGYDAERLGTLAVSHLRGLADAADAAGEAEAGDAGPADPEPRRPGEEGS
jgi:acetoin utilization deacetylase AcuC-like enzyme